MLELENSLETFALLINQNYEKVFAGYPAFPKFSIWRLMTKIWMKEILEKTNLGLALNDAFLRILNNHREKNVKESMNNNFKELNLDEGTVLPKELYINFNCRVK
jgi:hypothetical protein